MAAVAAWADGEHIAAIYAAVCSLSTLVVVILGLRRGYVDYSRFDRLCQIGILVGLLLWWIFNSPAVAVVAAVGIDAIGSLPTFRHAWIAPHEESWLTYAFYGLGGLFALLALTSYNWTSLPYATYILCLDTALVLTIFLSLKKANMERDRS